MFAIGVAAGFIQQVNVRTFTMAI